LHLHGIHWFFHGFLWRNKRFSAAFQALRIEELGHEFGVDMVCAG
jgi:hypothetical protein